MKLLLTLLSGITLCLSALARPADPGIYAIFSTSHGEFTCELFYQKAPKTVANFVGLAEGSLPFVDLQTGTIVKRPFYNGLTFHRVIAGFVIQSGSPNGTGTDGPGYQFPNEFDLDLIHDSAGILSMANAGPDTNGSQFFITVAEAEHLDFKHSVFGKVIDGLENVIAISQTKTNAAGLPDEPVTIESIEIIRNGTDATNFTPSDQGLPKLASPKPKISAAETFLLHYPRHQNRAETLFWSENLQNWEHQLLRFPTPPETDDPLDVTPLTTGRDRQFYRLITAEHGWVTPSVLGKRLTLNATSEDLTFVLNFLHDRKVLPWPAPLGTGSLNDGETVDLVDYIYRPEPVSGVVLFILDGLVEINVYLQFHSETDGIFTGIVNPNFSAWGLFGTFTLEEIE